MPPETTTLETKKSSISLPAAIMTGAVILGIALIITFGPKSAPTQPRATAPSGETTSVPANVATIRDTDRVRGDAATAEVAIIEYSDSDCPFCAKFHPTLIQAVDDYKGKVVWAYRYFPLSIHPNAITEAVAMECVAQLGGNSAFNNYLDTIINVTLNADAKSNEALTTYATAQGIDKTLFQKCMAGTTASNRVKADTTEAQQIGAQGTPFSILVNLKTGKQVIIPGAYPIDAVKADIDSLLK